VEGDAGDGWTLLRHAIDIEVDSFDQGDSLHVDVTALLISRRADPERVRLELQRSGMTRTWSRMAHRKVRVTCTTAGRGK
jgi:hypothetical protein